MKIAEQISRLYWHKKSLFLMVALFLISLAPLTSRGQNGNGMHDAIPIGMIGLNDSYYGNGNNSYYNGVVYDNNYNSYVSYEANQSSDVWYSFTVEEHHINLYVSLCLSDFDTYVHLLDANGADLAHNDNSSACGQQSILEYDNLPAGTYFLVVEGNGYSSGDYYIDIHAFASNLPPPIALGGSMENAIDAGILVPGSHFSDVRSNGPPLMGEIYHKFTLSATSDVTISHDGSAIDTYMSLLDEWFVIADAYDTGTSAYIR